MDRSLRRVLVPVAFAVAAAALASCSTAADLTLRANRSAVLALSFEIPPAVEAKLRSFSSSARAPAGMPLFDPASVAAGAKAKGLTVIESTSPRASAYRGSFSVNELDAFVTSSGLAAAGLFVLTRGASWASLDINVTRQNASILANLFPGMDRDLLEALQPPALYDNPVTRAEYRSMLAALLGKTAIEALDAAVFSLSISLPGPILENEGIAIPHAVGSYTSAQFTVAVLDALTLDTPVSFHIKWKE
ncbi:MAG: hypothetical protein E4H20_01790 [Spirochaetales bacterium]|nr:MAG: hypothetical protein E4H20_01790 [Spirochaetales bacterium]